MEAIIKEVYETKLGTAYETYRHIVKEHPSGRLQDVKGYLKEPTHTLLNSFISPGANYEYEVDLMLCLEMMKV